MVPTPGCRWDPYRGPSHGKCVSWHMRTAKAQISLRMRAVGSGPSMSANRIFGFYRMYKWSAKARMIHCECAGISESVPFAHVWRYCFAWSGLHIVINSFLLTDSEVFDLKAHSHSLARLSYIRVIHFVNCRILIYLFIRLFYLDICEGTRFSLKSQ